MISYTGYLHSNLDTTKSFVTFHSSLTNLCTISLHQLVFAVQPTINGGSRTSLLLLWTLILVTMFFCLRTLIVLHIIHHTVDCFMSLKDILRQPVSVSVDHVKPAHVFDDYISDVVKHSECVTRGHLAYWLVYGEVGGSGYRDAGLRPHICDCCNTAQTIYIDSLLTGVAKFSDQVMSIASFIARWCYISWAENKRHCSHLACQLFSFPFRIIHLWKQDIVSVIINLFWCSLHFLYKLRTDEASFSLTIYHLFGRHSPFNFCHRKMMLTLRWYQVKKTRPADGWAFFQVYE